MTLIFGVTNVKFYNITVENEVKYKKNFLL